MVAYLASVVAHLDQITLALAVATVVVLLVQLQMSKR
jgi:hypothetical protein